MRVQSRSQSELESEIGRERDSEKESAGMPPPPPHAPPLTPTSIKVSRFLKSILLEHTPLLACFGFMTCQKWLVSGKIN